MGLRDLFDRKKNSDFDSHTSLAERLMRHRLTILYKTVLIVLVIVAVVWVFIIQMKNRVFDSWQIISENEIQIAGGTTLLTLGENALIYSHDGAHLVNRKGDTVWNQTYEMQSPIVEIKGNSVAIGDYNGHTIYLMNTSSPQGTIDTGMPIKGLAVSDNGVVAAVLDDGDNVTWIYLYNSSGENIAFFKTTMSQSGYPIKVAISNNGILVGVSYLYMDRNILRDSVAFYNFGSVGRNEIDNFVSSYDYSEAVVPYLGFLDNGHCFAAGDSRLSFYEGDQKPVSSAEAIVDSEIKAVYQGGDYVALVFNDITGQAVYRVDIYDKTGTKVDVVNCDIQYTDMFFVHDKIMIYNGQSCIYRTVGGHDNYRGELPEHIMRMIPLSSAHEFMAVTGNGVKVLRLK